MMSNDGHAVHNPITLVKPIDKSTPIGNGIDDGAGLIMEHISIRYKDVTWAHHKARTSGYALWEMTKFMN